MQVRSPLSTEAQWVAKGLHCYFECSQKPALSVHLHFKCSHPARTVTLSAHNSLMTLPLCAYLVLLTPLKWQRIAWFLPQLACVWKITADWLVYFHEQSQLCLFQPQFFLQNRSCAFAL